MTYTIDYDKIYQGDEFGLPYFSAKAAGLDFDWGINNAGIWVDGGRRTPTFNSTSSYRFNRPKKRTVTIAGVELVAPETVAPKIDTKFFSFCGFGRVVADVWYGVYPDLELLRNGNVFLKEEDARAMGEIQRKQRLGGI